MAIHIQLRRDSALQWTSVNPILADGEIGLETDTKRFKIGNGILPWNQTQYGGLTLNNTNVEIIQLTAQNILDNKVTLALLPNPSIKTRVQIQGGPTQVINVDFYVVGQEVRWGSLGLQQLVEINDFLIIEYFI